MTAPATPDTITATGKGFRISGLAPQPFRPLFALDDAALAERGACRVIAEAGGGYPCRISLDDAAPGEVLLLLNYEHQTANTPYRSRFAIYIRASAASACISDNTLPPALRKRLLAIRAYSATHMLLTADICEGATAEPLIRAQLARDDVAYLHVHYAKFGCYAARVERI